ncbi:MAG: sugar phosphate isomerase/epimerase [Bacilli bacterium]|jgi:sugar phosphate isomerase/epimerase|nr:sugar phosphate isomerase/epimerase [Bacilli bacterium]
MALKGVQQFQLRNEFKNPQMALATLKEVKEAGFDGIELDAFLINRLPLSIRLMAKAAGMTIGSSKKINWVSLIKESGLKVIALHEDLNSVLNKPDEIKKLADSFATKFIVITGVRNLDYSSKIEVEKLISDLNNAGRLMKERNLELLYHNHNCELIVCGEKKAYDLIIDKTDPSFVNFEFDSYWMAEAGKNPLEYMKILGKRMRLYHINDRGTRIKGKVNSIVKSDSVELGYGNLDLIGFIKQAEENQVEAIILESHQNWVEKSALTSMKQSSVFLNENVKKN